MTAATIYVRRKKSDTWHWLCPVSRHPKLDDITKILRHKPHGDLCNWCKALDRERRKNARRVR